MDQEQIVLESIKQIQSGDGDSFSALALIYKPLMVSLVGKAYGDGSIFGDIGFEDLMQEASLALYSAAVNYDIGQSEVTFGLYAKICIKNRLITLRRRCVSRKNRQKRAEREQRTAQRTDRLSEPFVRNRSIDASELAKTADQVLSGLEKRVFALYADGLSYKEIAADLQLSEKSVDNAIYRIKCKLKKFI